MITLIHFQLHNHVMVGTKKPKMCSSMLKRWMWYRPWKVGRGLPFHKWASYPSMMGFWRQLGGFWMRNVLYKRNWWRNIQITLWLLLVILLDQRWLHCWQWWWCTMEINWLISIEGVLFSTLGPLCMLFVYMVHLMHGHIWAMCHPPISSSPDFEDNFPKPHFVNSFPNSGF